MQTERGRRSTIKSMAWLRAALPPPPPSSSSSSRPEFRPPAVPCDGDHPSNRSHGVPGIETLRGEGTWRRRSAVPGGSPGLRWDRAAATANINDGPGPSATPRRGWRSGRASDVRSGGSRARSSRLQGGAATRLRAGRSHPSAATPTVFVTPSWSRRQTGETSSVRDTGRARAGDRLSRIDRLPTTTDGGPSTYRRCDDVSILPAARRRCRAAGGAVRPRPAPAPRAEFVTTRRSGRTRRLEARV